MVVNVSKFSVFYQQNLVYFTNNRFYTIVDYVSKFKLQSIT